MRVIIAGGTGLIGGALATALADGGHETIVLSRHPERAQRIAHVRLERWDARTADGWGGLVDGAQAIVNLAGESLAGTGLLPSRWTAEKKRRIRESRLHAGQAVVQAVEGAANRPRLVVQASAVGYYGPRGDEEITEESPPGDDFLARIAREDWEGATAPVETLGVRRVIVRSGIVLSARGGALPRMMLPYRFWVGGPLGGGRQAVSWIHLADEIAAMRFLIEDGSAQGAFNLVAPNPLTNAEFGRALGRAMGRPSLVPVPAFVMRLLFGQVASVLLEGQRAIPRRLLDRGFVFRFPEVGAALRDVLA